MTIIYLHILNKFVIAGGIENLVYRIRDYKNDPEEKSKHHIFEIAPNNFARFIFSRSKVRVIILIAAIFRLLYFQSKMYLFHGTKVKFIFHTAESHLLSFVLNKLYFIGNRRIFYIYLHQSPSLYPKKILPYTLKLCTNERFHFILYSAQLLNGWKFNQKVVTKVIHAAPRNVRNRNSKYSIDPFLLFVGRDVAWKGLDVAIDFTARLNEYLPNLKLVVVGGDKNQLSKKWSNSTLGLNLDFIGNQISPPYEESLLTLMPSDCFLSLESVGIVGLESISYATPIVIRNDCTSDYLNFPGVYHISQILDKYRSIRNPINFLDFLLSLKLNSFDLNIWKSELSFDRYIMELEIAIGEDFNRSN